MSVLLGLLAEFVCENSPTAQKAFDKLNEIATGQKNQVENKYAQYQREAERMSTDRLKEAYKNLDSEKEAFKKSAYAKVLKERMGK